MPTALPQQRLLLELIMQSGDIAVPAEDDGTLLFRTLHECKDSGWLTLKPFGAGFDKASVTDLGRTICKAPR
ncbi:MAG: hypothetical protein HQL36_06330 [Alphaproteobacteria bacterium]|nr:hypothetical protein [Alphaproteobacteria bacterium]MBF0249630.1 hypothetical protein [Alphaproteobacteria bacterium]